jgi:CBS-domain-containing membrane protein
MTTTNYQTIAALLNRTKLVYALPVNNHDIVSVMKDETLPVAFEKLTQCNVQSVPVVDEGMRPIGLLDFIDILYFVLSTAEQANVPYDQTESEMELLRRELFCNVTCEDVMNFSSRNPKTEVTGDTHLITCLEFMVERNIHRLPVIRPDCKIIGIISQLDILQWMLRTAKECDPLSKLLDKNLDSFPFRKEVITISCNEKAKEAFYRIRETKVSAIAVVNHSGQLIANISSIDLNPIGSNSNLFKLLTLPLTDYISWFIGSTTALTASPNDSLKQIIELMLLKNMHRVYIKENDNLVGVVSPVDIIQLLHKETQK